MKPTIAVLADKSIVVLPSPPTDKEKYLYAVTWRLPLYIFGTFSFLAVSVGMWFFVIAVLTAWPRLGAFVVIIEAYLLISYFIGFCGRDFDLEGHKKIVEEHAIKDDEECPSVDVYLPCCKEPIEILENTYRYVSKIDYPNLKVWVLDDGDMESVRRLAAAYGFNYICRPNRGHLKKAGNLRHAFTQTNGDFFLIFDADFCPRADILKEMIPRVRHEPKIAIVQTPQFFRPCEEQTWSEQGASATQEFFYRIVQVNRDRFNAAICVGSNALYRRQALVDVGGTAEIGHSEDVHTGFYAVNRGWTLRYMPLALACGISPDTPAALFSQQMRWCAGSSYLLTNPEFWKSSLTWIQKICYMSGMMFYSSAAFMIIVSNLPGPLLVWLNPHLVLWYNCFFAVPSLIYATIIFRLWSRVNYNFNVNYVFTLQQYAYTMAIKDRIFGTTAGWVPSGDNTAHVTAAPEQRKKKPHTKYRNMRIVCFIWVWGTGATMFAGVAYRIWEGWYWWHFLPIMLFDAFQLFQSHKFIFYGQ
ncbi:nucleotide-diphospho-sugar transferase [Coprinellus micaceus]|uniref:Nucleotide-diphospho-sugar transferase n=1 Tax=Coprinellus micaceus TaxID=71717 RepID=A0A4Y7TTX0_COPMI|nr:nucleotide-diphospho-sugar transferase [Coprinellus micaceus]